MPNESNMATEAVPNETPNDCNMATEAVPNAIPNDCDMATELVPKEIENDYRIVYRMASQETVETTTKRWWPRSHSDWYHCRRTSHGDRLRGYRERYRTKPLTETLTEWRTEGSQTTAERHTELNAERFYQMTTEKPTDILPKLSSEWLLPRSGPPRPYQTPNQEMPESAYAKRLSESRSALL